MEQRVTFPGLGDMARSAGRWAAGRLVRVSSSQGGQTRPLLRAASGRTRAEATGHSGHDRNPAELLPRGSTALQRVGRPRVSWGALQRGDDILDSPQKSRVSDRKCRPRDCRWPTGAPAPSLCSALPMRCHPAWEEAGHGHSRRPLQTRQRPEIREGLSFPETPSWRGGEGPES